MDEALSRTALLMGEDAIKRLRASHVAVFGLGGVGGYAVEALARSGVGTLTVVDNDKVSISNLNRQILALRSTVGMFKTEAAALRIRDIDPDIEVRARTLFFTPETSGQFDFSVFDYVIDAIDTVTGKLELVSRCYDAGTPVVSCMGVGNKLDPTAFEVSDIFETSFDPLARIMRKELRRRGIPSLKVVWSREEAVRPDPERMAAALRENPGRRDVPGSCAFVPGAAGLIAAGEAICHIVGLQRADMRK